MCFPFRKPRTAVLGFDDFIDTGFGFLSYLLRSVPLEIFSMCFTVWKSEIMTVAKLLVLLETQLVLNGSKS